MNLSCAVLLLSFCGASLSIGQVTWFKDLTSPKGLDLGNGLTVQLKDNNKNGSFLERHALRMDYGDYGLSVKKSPRKDALEFGFSMKENGEGREEKDEKEHHHIAMILGYKLATIITMTLAIMGAFVLKALIVAKIALVTSAILVMSKLFHHDHHHHIAPHHHAAPAYVEIDHDLHTGYGDYSSAGGAYSPSASANYYSYSNYVPSGMAGNNAMMNYAGAESSVSNSSDSQAVAGVSAARRRDLVHKRKSSSSLNKAPFLTIHRYSVEAK